MTQRVKKTISNGTCSRRLSSSLYPEIPFFRSYQVRGHLAAQIDPLNLNNKTRQEAKKLVIRSVEVQDSDMDNVYQLPETTWIGGSVSEFIYLGYLFLSVLN